MAGRDHHTHITAGGRVLPLHKKQENTHSRSEYTHHTPSSSVISTLETRDHTRLAERPLTLDHVGAIGCVVYPVYSSVLSAAYM